MLRGAGAHTSEVWLDGALELGAVTPATGYLRAQRLRRRLAVRLQTSFQEHGVDALVTPAATGPAPADLATTGDSWLQLPWTFAGLPAISLPVGLGQRGMPLAIQLVGAAGADERLLAVARWCEQALDIDLHPPLA